MWNAGENWLVDSDSDNPVPAAKFRWDPVLVNYSSSLESNYINAATLEDSLTYRIWFDYEVKLTTLSSSATEKLTVEVWDGTAWNTVKEYPNLDSFDWTEEHLDISIFAQHTVFKVRFRANGNASDAIQYWAVDNIHIYSEMMLLPPMNLSAEPGNPGGNNVHLSWEPPLTNGSVTSFVLDDSIAEDNIYYSTPGECWLGNEFPVTGSGVLQSVSVFMETNGSATYHIDIFDENQKLAGNSANFIPKSGEWTTIELPFVAFNGTFYAMLHMVVNTESDFLYLDKDGPNSAANLVWYYEGTVWAHLTDLGFDPSVTLIRATAVVGDKKTATIFYPGNTGTNQTLLSRNFLVQKALEKQLDTKTEASSISFTDSYYSDSLMGYNVYRRAYAVFPPGQNTVTAGTWTMIASVMNTEYLDPDLSNLLTNCYEYLVTAVYNEGESVPSNIDWECIFVGIDPKNANQVSVYPNPATAFIRIDIPKQISSISVFNPIGSIMAEKTVKDETSITLNTTNYAAGVYSVKFTTDGGETFIRKFVVTK